MGNLAKTFIQELNSREIRYCHWKSNIDLEKALLGEGDLDLLVDRRDKPRFDALTLDLGFKRANSRWERQFPGMEDYAGWDEERDIIIHLHVHYQLVLGATYAKGIHLPIEQRYLSDTTMNGDIRVPERKNELVVFLYRHVLKARIYDLLINRKIKKRVLEELDYLEHEVSRDDVKPMLNNIGLSETLFEELMMRLRQRNPFGVLRVKRKLQREMKDRQRLSYFMRVGRPIGARLQMRLDALLGKNGQGKMPGGGGFMIAVVGSDGAGKSSMVEALRSWLGQFYSVSLYHIGKPKQSLVSYVMLRIASRLLASYGTTKDGNSFAKNFALSLQQFFLAKDRFLSICQIRRLVGQGRIVVLDRYPLEQLTTMESMASIEHLKKSDNAILRFIANKTASYYGSYDDPGLVLVLKVSPEVAAARRPEDDIELLSQRIEEINQIPSAPNTYFLDADSDHPLVIRSAKQAIWSWL